MKINVAFEQIALLCIIMAFGFLARKRRYLVDSTEAAISSLLVNIGMPALIIASANFDYTPAALPNLLQVFGLSFLYYTAAFLFAGFLGKRLKYEGGTFAVFVLLCVLPNTAYIGIPVVQSLLGMEAVFYVSMSNIVFNLYQWTAGVLVFDLKAKMNLKGLLNIGLISSIISLILFGLQVKFPPVVQSALDKVGSMTTPLSMLLIGSMIAKVSFKHVWAHKKVLLVSVIRLIVIPLLFFLITKPFHFHKIPWMVCLLIFSMPSGSLCAVMANDFHAEPIFASLGVFVTTIFCLISIPLVVVFITKFV